MMNYEEYKKEFNLKCIDEADGITKEDWDKLKEAGLKGAKAGKRLRWFFTKYRKSLTGKDQIRGVQEHTALDENYPVNDD